MVQAYFLASSARACSHVAGEFPGGTDIERHWGCDWLLRSNRWRGGLNLLRVLAGSAFSPREQRKGSSCFCYDSGNRPGKLYYYFCRLCRKRSIPLNTMNALPLPSLQKEVLLKRTTSRCPVCHAVCPAEVWRLEGSPAKVFLKRVCSSHGEASI